jgi:glycerol-3-phosphate acyltransferase PlsY
MLYICIAFAIIVPYLICSLNPAIVVTKIKSGKDIRELGSGNPGLTNTLRTQGKSAAVIVLLFDVFKGVISVYAVRFLYLTLFPIVAGLPHATSIAQSSYFGYNVPEVGGFLWLAALFAVLGHCFPIYYKFKGGKAILVTISALFVIDWLVALILLSLFIIIVAITRYVSLGSCISASMCPVLTWFFSGSLIGTAFATVIAAILIVKHRENIKRLVAGNEKKLGKSERVKKQKDGAKND